MLVHHISVMLWRIDVDKNTSVGWRNLNSANSCSPGEPLASIQSSNKNLQTPGPLYAPLCVLTFHLDKIYTLQGLIKTCLPGFNLSFLYDSTWVPLLLLAASDCMSLLKETFSFYMRSAGCFLKRDSGKTKLLFSFFKSHCYCERSDNFCFCFFIGQKWQEIYQQTVTVFIWDIYPSLLLLPVFHWKNDIHFESYSEWPYIFSYSNWYCSVNVTEVSK